MRSRALRARASCAPVTSNDRHQMKDYHDQIDIQLNELVETFSQPYSSSSLTDGWTEITWAKWGRVFRDLQDSFTAGKSLPDASIARAMDFDGITSGTLLDKASELSSAMRNLRNVQV